MTDSGVEEEIGSSSIWTSKASSPSSSSSSSSEQSSSLSSLSSSSEFDGTTTTTPSIMNHTISRFPFLRRRVNNNSPRHHHHRSGHDESSINSGSSSCNEIDDNDDEGAAAATSAVDEGLLPYSNKQKVTTTKRKKKRNNNNRDPCCCISNGHCYCCYCKLNRCTSILILICFLLWINTVLHNLTIEYYERTTRSNKNNNKPIRDRVKDRTKEKKKDRKYGLFDGIIPYVWDNMKNKGSSKGKKVSSEALPYNCERPEWQEYNFPNCNEVHEIDLGSTLIQSANNDYYYHNNNNNDNINTEIGYVASGLWRSVWAINSRIYKETSVLKMMKQEHDVNERNIDRHRRDALVMERLSSSKYVVDNYAYCANSVVTEYINTPLDKVILPQNNNEYDNNNNKKGEDYVLINNKLVQITPKQRVQWAIDVVKGVEALHYGLNLPIVHADLQAKQFLLSPITNTVKVNDFNRCRFMAMKKHDNKQTCTFRIPTAPGKMRSPEEYKLNELDEKLDIYSIANILYSIFTKEKAWYDYSSSETKNMIKNGIIPKFLITIKGIPHTIKEDIYNIIMRTYDVNPKTRINATELVIELERIYNML